MTLGYRIFQWKIPYHSRHLDVASLFSDERSCKEGWRQPDSFSLCKWFDPLCRRPERSFLCLQHPTSILVGIIFYFFPESLWNANWANHLRNVSLHHWIDLWHGFPHVHSLPFNFYSYFSCHILSLSIYIGCPIISRFLWGTLLQNIL